jgi:small subunit ribosomal protein S1
MSSEQAPAETPVVHRVQLNPTVDPQQAKPIPAPALAAAPPAPAAAPESPAATFVEQVSAPSATVVPNQGPVEIPSRKTSLEADLEAEIEAAMSDVGSFAMAGTGAAAASTVADTVTSGEESLEPGTKFKSKVVSIHGDSVILDLGARASGVVPIRSFEEGKLPEVGSMLDVVVDRYDPAEGLVHLHLAKPTVTKPAGDWNAIAHDQIVDCVVTKTNKGGLEVNVSNLRGFMPAGQVDLAFCSNLEQFVGQKLRAKVLEVNPQKKNLVVSRRAYLEIAMAELRDEAWKKLSVGQRVTGTVKTLKDYGAFVDIGGVDGLLHVSAISWNRIGHPKEVLKEGQQVEVEIVSLDREKSKIGLSMKQLSANPWHAAAANYPPNTIVHGKVTKTTEFGAFVELEPGLEGMVHISELEHRRVHRVTDVLQVGQEVDVKVLTVDPDKKRIALSVKALIARPEAAPKKSDEDLAPSGGTPYERKRKEPLKGGGTESGGMLFGNPGNY